MTTLARRFGHAARQLRKHAGYSQEAFARAAKIDRAYYSRIERGQANVSLAVIGRIAAALKVSFAELFAAVDAE